MIGPARSNCANRGFAGTTAPRHLAQTDSVLGRLVRAGPVFVHFAPAGPFFGNFAPVGSLPAHSARDGRVGALAWAGTVVGHFAQPVLGHLERVVRI